MPAALLESELANRSASPDDWEEFEESQAFVEPEDEEPPMGAKASVFANRLNNKLYNYVDENKLGIIAMSDCSYRCFPHKPLQTRRPDISFIRAERLRETDIPDGDLRFAPDLAIEYVSPHDTHEYLSEKIKDYLLAGVSLVWVINPKGRIAFVYRPGGSANWLTEEQFLDGEGVIPGFRLRLGDVLPPVPTME